jgi:integrin alpha FG-GAP repeat containing protein 1
MMLSQTSGNPDDIFSGAATSGSTFRFTVTTLEDKKQVRVATQLPQTSYNSLSLPYVYLGLGRSNNFIESLNVAYSINNKLDQVKVFTPIIPNSQMFILANNKYAKNWSLELFINPAATIYMIVIACGAVLVVTGVAIIILHIQEKKEDSKNRPQIDF